MGLHCLPMSQIRSAECWVYTVCQCPRSDQISRMLHLIWVYTVCLCPFYHGTLGINGLSTPAVFLPLLQSESSVTVLICMSVIVTVPLWASLFVSHSFGTSGKLCFMIVALLGNFIYIFVDVTRSKYFL